MNTPPIRQLALQGAAVILVLSLAWPLHLYAGRPFNWPLAGGAIGITACLLAVASGQRWWWQVIHLVFTPLAVWMATLAIDPGWFLLAFILLLLAFRSAATGQIPLYLSGSAAATALEALIRERGSRAVADLGAGVGSMIVPLAHRLPEVHFTGIENSPLPWAVGWLRTRGLPNVDWRWGSFWATSLHRYDLVYAFLSPAPMPALWEKARDEMASGTLLVSNSFAIPEATPVWRTEAGMRELLGYAPKD